MTNPDGLEHPHHPEAIAERLQDGARPHYVPDWIYGGIDGAITTFAIVAGSIGADLPSRVILILGASNILADGFSMAAANYTGTKADNDNADRLRNMEERHIRLQPEGEREEIRQIFAAKGFDGAMLEDIVAVITANKRLWVDTMLSEEHGIAKARRSPERAALATFAGFLACGLVPLLPFMLGLAGATLAAVVMTTITFALIGIAKSAWSPQYWWMSGLETLGIGLLAAAVAFSVGDLVARVI